MKIIGFGQLRNEIEKGNLVNWFKCMLPICDYIYIFDQNSTDGSIEFYKKFNNTTIIESKINRFEEELVCKHELLEKIKYDHPDTNFIQWLDGDELLDGRLINNSGQLFKQLCTEFLSDDYDGYFYKHKNLWRSDIFERIDSDYDWLDNVGVCKLWKFSKNIQFNKTKGLHQSVYYPTNIKKIKKLDFSLIHRGFATDSQIINKYNIYKSFGQKGLDLDRLLNEQTLSVQRIDGVLLPEWFEITDETNPTTKTKIRDIYNESQ